MSDFHDHYTVSEPLCREPGYLRQVRELAERTGGVTGAVATVFQQARIRVAVDGNTSDWRSPGQGALLVGDHRGGIEFAPLLALFGAFGREDVHFIGKPFSRTFRILNSLGTHAEGLTLPVIPRTLARDRAGIFNRDLHWRIAKGDTLPTGAELAVINAKTLERAAALISAGELVNLYPAGGVVDAAVRPWYRGLGTIIKTLKTEDRELVRVVLFRFDDFAATKVVRRLVLQSHGITPHRPYTITLRIGPSGTISELLGGAEVAELGAADITDRLRGLFVEQFGK